MSSSPSSVASKATPPSPNDSSQKPRAEAAKEPPRKQAEARSARERFSARLEQGTEKGTGRSERSAPHDALTYARPGLDESGGDAGAGHDGDGAQHDHALASNTASVAVQGTDSISITAASGTSAFDNATLERMAAQIAESWPGKGIWEASIEFPDTAIAQSAHITREPDGSIAVRIAGLDPNIAAVNHARLQLQLANALAQRRLRLGSLRFESADQPRRAREAGSESGDTSAIPRAV